MPAALESPNTAAVGWAHGWAFCRRHGGLISWFVATSLYRTAGTLASIFLIHTFLTSVLSRPSGVAAWLTDAVGTMGALAGVALALAAVFVTSSIAAVASQTSLQRLVRNFELDLVGRLVSHLLRLDLGFFEATHRGDLVESIRQDVSKSRATVSAAAELVVLGAQAVAYVGAALWLSPRLTLIALVTMLLLASPSRWLSKRMRHSSRALRTRGYRLTDRLLQLFHGIRTVKVYQLEALETRSIVDAARQYQNAQLRGLRTKVVGDALVEAAGNLGVVIVIGVGGLEVMAGRLTTPALVATLVALRAIHGPLNQGFGRMMDILGNWSSLERVHALLDTQPGLQDRADAVAIADGVAALSFDCVSFGYALDRPVLRDVSFEIRRGQHIGIVGPSGAGKTTLLHLAARFYDPIGGAVRLNGRDLRGHRLADWHARVAFVPQDAFVFATTVRENIRCGKLDASDAEVENAARAAGIHDEILQLTQGYDTRLGVGGHTLSAGQAQRIAIARAFLKNADVLLLDEATANLDTLAETKVRAALAALAGGRTTLTVAHRLSTVRGADAIVVLNGGAVVAQGAHDDLMRECGLYRDLWASQFGATHTAVAPA
jgi:ABC-type multidrug transport system fused ATPase/permease subunit